MNIWDVLTHNYDKVNANAQVIDQVKLNEKPAWVETTSESPYLPGLDSVDDDQSEITNENIQLDTIQPQIIDQYQPETDPPDINLSEQEPQVSTFPEGSACLGYCEDGVPLILDLYDSSLGSILVSGVWEDGPFQIFQELLRSALKINSPRNLRYTILTDSPGQWESMLSQQDHRRCLGVLNVHSKESEWMILKLAERGRQIALGLQPARINLVFIDSLDALDKFEFDTRLNFEWLLREGPRLGIWVIAFGHSASLVEKKRIRFPFPTKILGHIPDLNQARIAASLFQLPNGTWPQPHTLVVKVKEQLFNFSPA